MEDLIMSGDVAIIVGGLEKETKFLEKEDFSNCKITFKMMIKYRYI